MQKGRVKKNKKENHEREGKEKCKLEYFQRLPLQGMIMLFPIFSFQNSRTYFCCHQDVYTFYQLFAFIARTFLQFNDSGFPSTKILQYNLLAEYGNDDCPVISGVCYTENCLECFHNFFSVLHKFLMWCSNLFKVSFYYLFTDNLGLGNFNCFTCLEIYTSTTKV